MMGGGSNTAYDAGAPKKGGPAAAQRRLYPNMNDQSFDSTLMSRGDTYYTGAHPQYQADAGANYGGAATGGVAQTGI